MKHRIFKRALSLTSAAVVCCSALPSLSCFSASASVTPEANKRNDAQFYRLDGEEIVKVIVKVKGDAVMEQPDAEILGTDYLETTQAEQITSQLISAQTSVQNSIRRLYPELNVSYSYQVLVNGFSCELPEKLIEEVEALPMVESVSRVAKHTAPKMAKAAALSGFPSYFDQTGCSGEGQVIAVIDSELDVTHPMFAPLADDIETALSKDDVADIIENGNLNVDVDPERAYISNKLPFVIDYVNDPYEGVPEPDAYHGTHVSGIAAGNEVTDAEGKTISGIAKDAQLIFMGVSAGMGYIDDTAALAAIEDAVKLHADVINMSWGDENEYYGENPISEAITNAENAGVVACIAAGNSDNGNMMYGRVNTPDNPDVSTMNGSADRGVGALFVASADNDYTVQRHTFVWNGERIVYRPTVLWEEFYLDSYLEPGDYEYVDCGNGDAESFANADVEGKIALVQRGTVFFEEMAMNAEQNGAIGIILADKEIPDGLEQVVGSSPNVAFALVTYEEGQMLRDAENKTISIDSETIGQDVPTKVSNYTSWGVKESLDLRPDIMGIGGNVESAAYDQGEEVLSGTSMATPYLSGCVAVMRQHMKKLNLDLDGKEQVKYIRNLLMNSAVPYTENDMYVTPRRQGAGLVSLDHMLANKVVVTGAEGEAKVNLYDNLSENFSFDINLANISEEDVAFTDAKLVLTTDDTGVGYDFYGNPTDAIVGQQVLNCSADLSGLLSIGAGQSRTETVSVSLDPAQCAALRESFVNGFFAEGYLVLEGAENCCDITVPLLGFCGDWASVPVYREETVAPETRFGNYSFSGALPLSEFVERVAALRDRVPSIYLTGDPNNYRSLLAEYDNDLYNEIDARIKDKAVPLYVSPNGDSIADSCNISFEYIRQCKIKGVNVYDEDGNLVVDGHEVWGPPRQGASIYVGLGAQDLDGLPDGKYTGTLDCTIDYPTSKDHPQTISKEFYVDNTAPAVESEIITKDGRQILRLTASDAGVLDGIYISGKGKGGIAGSYNPNAKAKSVDYAFAVSALLAAFEEFPMYEPDERNTDQLSFLGHLICRNADMNEIGTDTFMDVIPAVCDENGTFSVEYDVTDLTAYSVEVLDRAFNITTLYFDQPVSEQLLEGIFYSSDSFYEITPDMIRIRSCRDGSIAEYAYTFAQGELTLTDENGTETVYAADVLTNSKMRFRDADGKNTILNAYQDAETLEDIRFITLDAFMEKLYEKFRETFDAEPLSETVVFISPDQVNVTLKNDEVEADDHSTAIDIYNISLLTGSCYSFYVFDHFGAEDIAETSIQPGFYYDQLFGYIQFNEDHETGSLFDFMALSIEDVETPFSYSFDENGIMTVHSEEGDMTGRLQRAFTGETQIQFDDGRSCVLNRITDQVITAETFNTMDTLMNLVFEYEFAVTGEYPFMLNASMDNGIDLVIMIDNVRGYVINPLTAKGTFWGGEEVDLNHPPTLPAKAFTMDELRNMASVDYEKRTGKSAPFATPRIHSDGSVTIDIYDENHVLQDIYTIDAVTGKGEDLNGKKINLPKTGIMNPDTFLTATAAFLMMMIGAGVCVTTIRKKEEQ
ncbi:MAG TPA: hypothetical protein DCG49_05770 [Ruminococcus sp.]|nr:hypothetical protein [Ruminococcus sp.]